MAVEHAAELGCASLVHARAQERREGEGVGYTTYLVALYTMTHEAQFVS